MISKTDNPIRPRIVTVVIIICMFLIITIGSWVQLSDFPGFLAGIYVTEWLLILLPPLLFLKIKRMDLKKTLSLEKFRLKHMLIGIMGGIGGFFIFTEIFLFMQEILGYYPEEFLEPIIRWFPKNWIEFIPWILGIAFSAGICEEVLFRGFIQNGLERSWGPLKALIVASILFGAFHLDPWRSPPAAVLGLIAGYLLLKTRSLFAPISFHITTNSIGQILTFMDYFPQTSGFIWILIIIASSLFIILSGIFARLAYS